MRILGIIVSAGIAFSATPAGAFGLKTHLWIAQTIYDDMADCRLELRERKTFEVPREVCTAVLAHRGEFLAGAIGPDAFPDIVTGQSIIHPGDKGPWFTADWLNHLFDKAAHPAEIAFSAGFLLHAAGDIFAHSYVNNYAGDFFDLKDDRLVERRHTLLERYIDQHLPDPASGPVSPDELDAPFGFIANALIFDPEAAAANASKPFGRHHERLAWLRNQVRGYIVEARDRVSDNWADLYGRPPGPSDLRCAREVDPENPRSTLPRPTQGEPDTQAARELRDAIEALAFVCEWEWSLQISAREYLRASLDTSRQIMTGRPPADPADPDAGEITRHYAHWFDCHGKALLGEPVEIGRSECRIRKALGLRQDYRDLRTQAILPRFGRFIAGFRAWRRQLGEDVARALLDNSLDVLRTTRGLIADMTREEAVTRADLDTVFKASERKRLLAFPRSGAAADAPEADRLTAWQLVEKDMGLPAAGGKLDPDGFKALDYALLLGKLALLDRDALKAVTSAYGGETDRLSTSSKPKRYSILMDMARSLDGNHQWMRYAMPYPRRSGAPEPAEPADREYGFDHQSGGPWKGFSFYADPQLRKTVFKALFPAPFEGQILCRSEFRPTAYNHPVVSDDPFRSDREKFCSSGRD